jgi:hypothetical protein
MSKRKEVQNVGNLTDILKNEATEEEEEEEEERCSEEKKRIMKESEGNNSQATMDSKKQTLEKKYVHKAIDKGQQKRENL